ncbi:MAG TPA: hypothetical protein VGR78_12170, partial [Verrucomicrobiae bacterium]|nr:hypothetical protein [Verrucomicrobiae bacterium]
MNTLINYLVNRAGLGIAVLGLLARPARAQFTDTVPPTLVSATFSPNPVDVTSDDASVTLSLHITDDLSGIDFAANSFSTYVQIAGPSGQYLNLYGWNFLCTGGVPGDLDTTWDSTFTVYKGTENGDWRLTYMNLYDRAGNGLYLDYLALGAFNPLSVLSFSDTTPPT